MRQGAAEQIASEAARAAARAEPNSVQNLLKYQLPVSTIGGEGGIRTPDRLAPMPHFECGAFDHSATSPGVPTLSGRPPVVGASSRRGRRGRQGAGRVKFAWRVKPTLDKGGTARRDKNRRSRVASLKLWPGSEASPVRLSDGLTVPIRAQPATRTLF